MNASNRDPIGGAVVADRMHPNPVVIRADASLSEAVELMDRHRVHRSTPLVIAARTMTRRQIHRLIVVADGDETTPIGVLSMTDLIHALAEETAMRVREPSR